MVVRREFSARRVVEIVMFRNAPAALSGTVLDLRAEFLPAGEFRDREGIQSVDDIFVGEHDFED